MEMSRPKIPPEMTIPDPSDGYVPTTTYGAIFAIDAGMRASGPMVPEFPLDHVGPRMLLLMMMMAVVAFIIMCETLGV